ncbi:WbqC family protein [Pseudomonas fluorescens]|uniref:WbqC family protein n=1 Tax=Pseudomonas fluorescens TaxID=294 RepID=UPI0006421584|nr:WbqC family protein [Pseudomonas fluorescens]
MKTVVILQSNYIPWKGYFDLIHDADEFIFLDDVQFTTRDWRTRNKVKTTQGAQWITVPAGADSNRIICDVEIKEHAWQTKHYKTIVSNYSKTPYFDRYKDLLKNIYLDGNWQNLSKLNQFIIKTISKELGIKTTFKDSREYGATARKEDRLLEILAKSGGSRYISGPAAKDYIDPQSFQAAGVELIWKSYAGYPEYPQRFMPFEHGVSILDLLFNVGPDAPWYIWGWREGGTGPT